MTTFTRRANGEKRQAWLSAGAPLLASAGLLLGGSGCVTMPFTGVKASGEPLVVDVQTEQRSAVVQQRTGEVVNKDANGNVTGTSEVYQDKVVNYNVTRWQVFQGNERIDDQDFFRIAGDAQAADQIESMRNSAVNINHGGLVVLLVGIAAIGAGAVLTATATQSTTDSAGNTTNVAATWPRYVLGGGVLTALVGGGLMFYSAGVIKREHPIEDPRRAKRDADKYNATLSTKAGAEAAPTPKIGNVK